MLYLFHTEVTALYGSIESIHYVLLPNVLYKELLSIFDCLATFLSLPVRSGFEGLFPGKTFLTVSQSRDRLISCTLMTINAKLSSVTL